MARTSAARWRRTSPGTGSPARSSRSTMKGGRLPPRPGRRCGLSSRRPAQPRPGLAAAAHAALAVGGPARGPGGLGRPMELSQRLSELARNLYWAWHPEVVSVFRDLDVHLSREVHHNPMEMLARLAARAEGKASPAGFDAALTRASSISRITCSPPTPGAPGTRVPSACGPSPISPRNSASTNHSPITPAVWASSPAIISRPPPIWPSP